jgi:hypothetical protein
MTERPLLRDEPIYQLERDPKHPGVWQLYGLNLLGWDDLPDIDPLLAFKVALASLLSDDPAPAVLVGGYTLPDAHWREYLGGDLTEVGTSIYCGDLFEATEGLPGVFAPGLPRETVLSELMDYCYLADNDLLILAEAPEPRALAEVLARLRKLAGWVIVPGHDGHYLEIWSERPDAEERLAACAVAADQAVRQLPWFAATWERLRWNDLALCYREPDKG